MAPTVQEEPLTGYKIRYWESDKDVSQANDTTVYIGSYDFKLEATISDLSPGKTYYLRVLAFSQGGEGKLNKLCSLKKMLSYLLGKRFFLVDTLALL